MVRKIKQLDEWVELNHLLERERYTHEVFDILSGTNHNLHCLPHAFNKLIEFEKTVSAGEERMTDCMFLEVINFLYCNNTAEADQVAEELCRVMGSDRTGGYLLMTDIKAHAREFSEIVYKKNQSFHRLPVLFYQFIQYELSLSQSSAEWHFFRSDNPNLRFLPMGLKRLLKPKNTSSKNMAHMTNHFFLDAMYLLYKIDDPEAEMAAKKICLLMGYARVNDFINGRSVYPEASVRKYIERQFQNPAGFFHRHEVVSPSTQSGPMTAGRRR